MNAAHIFRKLEKWLVYIWIIIILVISTVPIRSIRSDGDVFLPHADKVVHFLMYFVFQILLMNHNLQFGRKASKAVLFIMSFGYGFLLECIQGYFLVERAFDNYDIIANITGALAGSIFFNIIKS